MLKNKFNVIYTVFYLRHLARHLPLKRAKQLLERIDEDIIEVAIETPILDGFKFFADSRLLDL
ncbi:MAG: hypothetical protein A2W61_04490 [Deltaproteobacteria bacterium RIFCSPLOWO2_01_44_7]|nr:MAG: hypothetical protein A2712_00465 [Deltaproteobacteria bacterium RIFCSPHIGHO2_01_FULL_43_49]OGQ14252.1 MAG: hypothetical protein A3D22_10150 [Deltaproteobacteria bacterium RIFCSPHIGHO2_02_FULL_44_53]OGQ27468.1 MAG: hypothetical protein A3D98_03750 [Deltaproteobacteria bacterium RIFCSPHIGHO2_12_FULL_44_21]OGQ30716.1 MAG: hypothetical protein A2979_06175 [Deltaproteobacteria bacterium RIFCSPLOWO2_01_FULL_45_74]OGQ41418.1 MAG: hypothetical protein A2W61_04490 [Deltaproteobacteria bacterium 